MNRKSFKFFILRPATIVIILAFIISSGAAAQSEPPPISGARIVASEAGDWLWTTEFDEVPLQITIYASDAGEDPPLWSDVVMPDANGFAYVGVDIHGQDLQPGNRIDVSDGTNSKSLILVSISMDVFDTLNETMAGIASAAAEVWAFAGPMEWQQPLQAVVDPVTGAWTADFTSVGYDISEDMRPWSYAHIYDLDGDANEANPPPPVVFRDDFDGPLADGWTWINENEDMWDFTTDPAGFLRINTSPYGLGGENLLLRSVLPGDFAIETHFFFEPVSDFQIAGLVLYQDDGNFIQLGRAFCDVPEACVGNGIYFDYVDGGGTIPPNFAFPTELTNEAYLRLERRGGRVIGLYSSDGEYWIEVGTHWLDEDIQFTAVGLTSSQNFYDTDNPVPADFDYFELTEGWGFLPEGYHDYSEGDVVHWDCNAGGWAVDPDERYTDIPVRVLVDGEIKAELSAGEYRSDLEENGGCVGGSCGFNAWLWNDLEAYVPHEVAVFAKDNTSDKWVRLSASPKSLTCRTFDIYSFDPVTSETKQITNMRDADEYNPAWSPNGQYVVHHTVLMEGSGGLYITDVKTGESHELPGAEWGGWQSWSPNSRWIIFGRDNNLYMVPPTGTEDPLLVRENAEMASFAPNGKRIVFRDTTDGSIRTMQIDRGKGRETDLGVYGTLPEWSPDGNWIVYESNSDIWKIGVNMLGMLRSEPIQLTHLVQGEGHATWSPDGQTIVYHAGLNTPDWDLWSVPAAGGEPTWLNGAPNIGDYDPDYGPGNGLIAYASASPYGQAPRTWVAAYTHDLGPEFWSEGTHTYKFLTEGQDPTELRELNVSINNPRYDGTALLRPGGIRLQLGEECAFLEGINPSQPTQFNIGWTADGTYADAAAYLDSLMASAVWDAESPVLLDRHEIFPLTNGVDWGGYMCSYSAGPPKMDLRINYGHDWVESFYEAGHRVDITLTDNEGSVKATATSFTGPREEWVGAEGFQTAESDWSPAPPDIQPYDWVYAVVDNGVTARVQIGDVQGEVRFDLDEVTGTVLAPWIDRPVQIECLDWGSGLEQPLDNLYPEPILTDGEQAYSCSWGTDWDIQPWQDIGVGYFTPDGHWVANAHRDQRWMAFWTIDLEPGFWSEGMHSYFYTWSYTTPDPGGANGDSPPPLPLLVASEIIGNPIPIYPTYALLGPWPGAPQHAWTGEACEVVPAINPDQATRFAWGWVNDFSMTYDEALAHYNSFIINVFWDDVAEGRSDFSMTELVPWYGAESRAEFFCGLTEHP